VSSPACGGVLSASALLIAALAALLVFAADASAETRTGETTSAFPEGPTSPEAMLVKSADHLGQAGLLGF
jgi:hypothetical protein